MEGRPSREEDGAHAGEGSDGATNTQVAEGAAPVAAVGTNEGAGDGEVVCAVCLISTDLTLMPCCGKETSTTRFCLRCIELICHHGGGVGKCPKCRKPVVVENGAVVVNTRLSRCRMCRQMRTITGDGMCDSCNVGSRRPLVYECERCRRRQRIPHPMYRYQPSPQEYCNSSWACHQGCGDYTRWRIVPEDVAHVPPDDAPESWGLQEAYLAQIRAERQREAGPAPARTLLENLWSLLRRPWSA